MNISNEFYSNVIQIYGEAGEDWLVRVPDIIDRCSEKWGLSNLVLLDNFSNIVLFGSSSFFGDVVLKIGMDITTEINALSRLSGPAICQCYAMEETLGALLLERITPGNDLTTVPSEEERIIIAAKLMLKLSVVPGTDVDKFPTYSQLIEKDFNSMRKGRTLNKNMALYIERAEKFLETNSKAPSR
ncbi:hypothetical protein [Paenibacillus methanolicus]|uniref:Uncharacterized protein n=1 Tax=Paenibacillus methanolicus TaxID=582686 RepID=A0A5S5C8A0_9BACL|nr:hypothetical protein [Paenibacillus methanolicus]TYP74616.1 hypothetical protein BCM02_105160 [Paenibacillus methanolicus]